jgi:hypothetical protein
MQRGWGEQETYSRREVSLGSQKGGLWDFSLLTSVVRLRIASPLDQIFYLLANVLGIDDLLNFILEASGLVLIIVDLLRLGTGFDVILDQSV